MKFLKRLFQRSVAPASFSEKQWQDATERWIQHNARKREKGCRCGKPGTRVHTIPVMGAVPCEIWSCDEHYGVNAWVSSKEGILPAWERNKPCPDYCRGWHSSHGPIGKPPTGWTCTIKPSPEDASSAWS